jgi:hypothetical protein
VTAYSTSLSSFFDQGSELRLMCNSADGCQLKGN